VIEGGRLRYNSRKAEEKGWVTVEDLPAQQPPVLRQWLDAILYKKELPAAYGLEAAVMLTVLTENEYIAHREGRVVKIAPSL
jgi:hypothetical protein